VKIPSKDEYLDTGFINGLTVDDRKGLAKETDEFQFNTARPATMAADTSIPTSESNSVAVRSEKRTNHGNERRGVPAPPGKNSPVLQSKTDGKHGRCDLSRPGKGVQVFGRRSRSVGTV